jgi:hypothetical protein
VRRGGNGVVWEEATLPAPESRRAGTILEINVTVTLVTLVYAL